MTHQTLKQKTDLHFARYVFHVLAGVLLALSCYHLPKTIMVLLLAALAVFMIFHDVYRLKVPAENDRVIRITSAIMREDEKTGFASSSYYIAGCFLTVLLFPRDIAVAAILFLALGDPIAALIGNRFGRVRPVFQKSVAGAVSCFGMCTLVTLLLNYPVDHQAGKIVSIVVLSGVVGMVAELIPIGGLNDNLTMPLLSALGLLLIETYLISM